jgi:hypothetical protein
MAKAATKEPEQVDGLEQRFGIELPYTMSLRLRGVTPFLFNRMDIESYDNDTGPGTKRKPRKRPEYDSMVWWEDGELAYPTQSVLASIIRAGKFYKTLIGTTGSLMTTLSEALVPAAEHGKFGVKTWDAIDFRHAKHGNIARTPKPTYRPRLETGWHLDVSFGVVLPELFGPAKLLEIIARAGSVMGIGDGRKIGFGRYVPDGHEAHEGLPW